MRTLIDLELRNGLPSVHRNSPSLTHAAAAEVNDKLFFIAI